MVGIRLYVNTLGRAQRETIGCRLLSTGELLELHAALERAQRLRRRAWRRAAVLSFALDAALLGMTAYAAGPTPAVERGYPELADRCRL